MAITLNGVTVTSIKLNSTEIEKEELNGTVVYDTGGYSSKTTSPYIQDMTDSSTYKYRVKNLDSNSATIYADYNVSPPTTNRGTIASGTYTTTINTGIPSALGGYMTIYARAQASGKAISDIVSLYIERN